mmetsp:Transcript_73515/g.137369  ORF Transcript_73515/g.137369 Transcript_73515/m.137369 type:complete len:205 (-) Transcript_73515:97-711(-)
MAVTRALFLVAVAVGWRNHAAALFFELPDGGATECFGIQLELGMRLHGSFEASGDTEGIKSWITLADNPDAKKLWESSSSSGSFDCTSEKAGTHHLCFTNSNQAKQVVSFSFRLPGDNPEDKEYITTDHTDKVHDLVKQLQDKAQDILDQQQFSITREAVHRDLSESTNSRVMWWTLVEVVMLICLAVFQVYYLRSYFEVKTVI